MFRPPRQGPNAPKEVLQDNAPGLQTQEVKLLGLLRGGQAED